MTENTTMPDDKRLFPELPGDEDEQVIGAGVIALVLLLSMFFLLSRCGSDDPSGISDRIDETTAGVALDDGTVKAALNADDEIVISGRVPDRSTADRIIAAANARYGADNVIDELTLDDGVSLDDGRLLLTGELATEALQDGTVDNGREIAEELGLRLDDETTVAAAPAPTTAAPAPTTAAPAPTTAAPTPTTAAPAPTTAAPAPTTAAPAPATTAAPAPTTTSAGLVIGLELENQLNAVVQTDPILFATSSATILPESQATLDRVVALLDGNTEPIEVQGWTDPRGSDDANQALSQARAEAVVSYLTSKGVDGSQLQAAGKGETGRFGDITTAEGLALNRRIVFVVGS